MGLCSVLISGFAMVHKWVEISMVRNCFFLWILEMLRLCASMVKVVSMDERSEQGVGI